ncbi:MAG: efflux RND transporter permease subunit [Caldilineaceae bacterium]|nr:efflux RND transporter permease subunit [Caldilineaceae bacterium]
MIRWLIETSLRARVLTLVIAALILVVGITQLRAMPIDVFPEFDPPLVEVQTEALGLSAAEVESLITVPMEADLLNGVAWLDRMYSESVASLSSILLVFEPGTDPIQARQMVQERLTQAHALPNVSKPPVMLQPISSNNRVLMVGLSSESLSLVDLGVLARWDIKPRLLGVPGVANVAVWGHRDRQLQVQVDPAELHAQGVRLSEVVKTTGEALWVSPLTYLESSKPGTGGWIDTPNQRLGVRHLLPIASPEDLSNVAMVNHPDLLLGDVATVVEDHQQLIGDATINGAPGMILVIEKFPNANTLEVTAGVESVLDDMRAGLSGVAIDTSVFRPANYIDAMTNNLSTALAAGLGLALAVLLLFLWNWRTALVSIIVIPTSVIAAGMVLYWRGETLNIMTIAGLVIALGVIIDDVVVDMAHVTRRLRMAREMLPDEKVSAFSIMQTALLESRSSVVYATLILLLVILPIFFMQGLTGLFFTPLVASYAIAILTSMVVALVLTPGLALLFMPTTAAAPGHSPLVRAFERVYGGLAGLAVRGGAYGMMALAAILLVVGVGLYFMLTPSLIPSFQQSDVRVSWEAEPGTSHEAMMTTIAQVGEELRGINGVAAVSAHVGRAETGDLNVSINSADLWVNLADGANRNGIVNEISAVTANYPGVFNPVQTYMPERLNDALLGPESDLTVRIYGVDLEEINAKAAEIAERIGTVNGVASATVADQIMEPQVAVRVDLAAAEQYGILPGDVRRQATTLLSGLHVGSLFEEQKVFDVIVWAKPELRDEMTDLENLLIATPAGEQVALHELATVEVTPSPLKISRDAVSRYADVTVTVAGRSVAAVTTDIRSALLGVEFPLEARAEILAESLAVQAARQQTLVLIVAAIVGIYLLVQAAFGGWRLALGIVLTFLAALSGGLIGALLTGGVLSLGVLFGLLAILGIAVRNSLATISHVQRLELSGEETGPALVQRSVKERSGAIFTTALTTAAAMVPILILGNIPGLELLGTTTVVLLCGLVTTTLSTLLVIPALYARFRTEPDPENLVLSGEPVMGAAD